MDNEAIPRCDLRTNLLLSVVAIILSLGLAEAILHYWWHYPPGAFQVPRACCGTGLTPNAQGWFVDEGEAYVAINSQGMRDIEHSYQAPPNMFRIAILGDSFTEALQLPMEKAFWWVMKEHLNNKCERLQGRQVEVINFGVSAYGTVNELLALRHRVGPFSPDMVMLAFFGNDIQENSRELDYTDLRPYFLLQDGKLVLDDRFITERPDFMKFEELQLQTKGSFWDNWLRSSATYWLIKKSNIIPKVEQTGWRVRSGLVQWLHSFDTYLQVRAYLKQTVQSEQSPASDHPDESEVVSQPRPTKPYQGVKELLKLSNKHSTVDTLEDDLGLLQSYRLPADRAWREAWEVTEALVLQIDQEVRMKKAQFTLAVLSQPLQVHPNAEARAEYMQAHHIEDFYMERRLAHLAESNSLPYLILGPEMRQWAEANHKCVHGFSNAWPCSGHWNAEGHRLAGELLAKKICEAIPLRSASLGGEPQGGLSK